MESDSTPPGQSLPRVSEIDLAGIAEALDDAGDEAAWWYDPATGEVEIGMSDWGVRDEMYGEAGTPEERGLVSIHFVGSREAYQNMVDFADSVTETHAANMLHRALRGKGAFRRFQDALSELPEEMRQHWLTYSAACSQARAIDWLLTSGHVDPDDGAREAAAREATADEVRATISNDFGLKINESELLDRWDEVCREIESGQTVTVLRDGQPLAIVTPP